MLTREFVGCLAKVHGGERCSFPEFVERRCQAERDANIVQRLGPTFREAREQGRHAIYVTDFDSVGLKSGGFELGIGDADDRVNLGWFGFGYVGKFTFIEICEQRNGPTSIAHIGVLRIRSYADYSSSR